MYQQIMNAWVDHRADGRVCNHLCLYSSDIVRISSMLLTIQGLGHVFPSASADIFENTPKQARLCPFQILTQAYFMKRPTISSSRHNF
jgi:hypothetical protein